MNTQAAVAAVIINNDTAEMTEDDDNYKPAKSPVLSAFVDKCKEELPYRKNGKWCCAEEGGSQEGTHGRLSSERCQTPHLIRVSALWSSHQSTLRMICTRHNCCADVADTRMASWYSNRHALAAAVLCLLLGYGLTA
jgi:hypothetical protein